MENIFKKIGVGLADAAKWVADAVKNIVGLAAKIEKILRAEKPLEKPFVNGLSTVINDVERLLTDSSNACSEDGLSLSADSAAYQSFLALVHDFGSLAPVVEQALKILEGKATA